jgi:solute carrier family 6 (neurotransmitter transporter, GABA) member 1
MNRSTSQRTTINLFKGYQLTHDINYIVCVGKQWRLPVFWSPLLRYFTAPVLSIIYAFAYPTFYATRGDPLDIFGFIVAHLIILVVLVGLIIPKSLNFLVPPKRRDEGTRQYAPRTVLGKDDTNIVGGVQAGQEEEAGLSPFDSSDKTAEKK